MTELMGILLIIFISVSLPILLPLAGLLLMGYMIMPTSDREDEN